MIRISRNTSLISIFGFVFDVV